MAALIVDSHQLGRDAIQVALAARGITATALEHPADALELLNVDPTGYTVVAVAGTQQDDARGIMFLGDVRRDTRFDRIELVWYPGTGPRADNKLPDNAAAGIYLSGTYCRNSDPANVADAIETLHRGRW